MKETNIKNEFGSGSFGGSTFEGSYGGDNARISDTDKMECKICWKVYDPAEGDDYWQIPAGTPFSKLPDHWRCPECDGTKDQFMVIKR